jgi:thiamine pyrophosphokinase
MKTIIISNGEINNYKFFSNIVESADRIICADGGIRHAMNMKLTPDVIIGDMDSSSAKHIEYFREFNPFLKYLDISGPINIVNRYIWKP